ncbi:MAG: CPBP family intramembrane metalloprotease [Ruminococcus sp.]|nr:CPBP family intramembrane metalloprotease [Ruminococcus sp.]
MNFDPSSPDYPLYDTQLAIARRQEKRQMFIDCSKLGALLILYNILTRVTNYLYYIVAASVHSGSFIPLPSDAINYLREHQEVVQSTTFSMAGNLFIVAVSVTVVLVAARFLLKVRLSGMARPRLRHFSQGMMWMPLCIVINTVIAIIVTILQNYLSAFGVTIPESDFSITTPTTLAIVFQFVYVIIVGPFVEEVVYRGLILTLLKPYGKWLAIFVSALIFGMMHGNIPQMASAFASAIIMGIIAVQCDSIIPTLIIHIMNNITASITDFTDALGWSGGYDLYICIKILIFFAGLFVAFTCWRKLRIKEGTYAMTGGQRAAAVFTNIPMLVYLGYLLYQLVKGIVEAN